MHFSDAASSSRPSSTWRALRSKVTLRGVAFLALKFPLGVATLIVLGIGTALSLMPFAAALAVLSDGGGAALLTVPSAAVALAAGVGALLVLAVLVDALAGAWAGLAAAMLTRGSPTTVG